MAKNIFDAAPLLASQGVRVIGAKANGVYDVEADDGTVGTLDLNEVLKSQNIDPRTLSFEVNSPSEALDVSPVGILDRGALALGNAKGKLGYLKKRFEDVKYDQDKGLVVKDKGLWQTVDPTGLGSGDPWEMTKELVKDVIDVSDIALSAGASTAGAVVGTAAAGPAGAVAGAGAGGGLAEGLKTSLGRLAGTYDATPEEQLKDIAIETVLNMGGETVALGAKAGLKQVAKAFKNIGSAASDNVKNMLSETIGKVSGAGSQATRTMLDQTDEVVKELSLAKVGASTTDEVIGKLRDSQLKMAQNILEEAPKELSRRYGELKNVLLESAKDMPKVDVGRLAVEAMGTLEDSGLVKRVFDKESGRTLFQVMDDATAVELRNQGKNAAILAPNVQKELEPILNQLNQFSKLGEFQGAKAAGTLMDLKRTVNDIYRDLAGPSTAPGTKQLLDQFRTSFSHRIGEAFGQANLTPQYMATVNVYQQFADAVTTARRLARHENGAENFVRKLVSDAGANRTLKDLAMQLSELMGDRGKTLVNSIITKEAAKGFSSWLPRTGLLPHVAGAGAIVGAVTNPAAAAATMAASSPRLALSAVKVGRGAMKLVQSLPTPQKISLLQNDQLMESFLRTTFTATMEQQALADQLTKQATGGKQ